MDDLKPMFNPMHPGEFIQSAYLTPLGLSGRDLAVRLAFSASTVNRLLTGAIRVSPEMAVRLATVLGRSAESWLAMQNNYDLWIARKTRGRPKLTPLELSKVS